MVVDPQLGSLVMVAAGGTLVEVLRDRRFALPPLDGHRARALLDRLALRRLPGGVRGHGTAPVDHLGGAPADLGAVAAALVRLGALACELGDLLAALDVNPLIAGPDGCVAVDALVLPAATTPPVPTPPAARAGDGHGARAKAARRRSRAR